MLVCSVIIAVSCNINEPEISTPDEETAVMKNNSQTVLYIGNDSIILNEYNFFCSPSGKIEFMYFGEMDYLFEIDDVPDNKWEDKIAAVPRNGYILYFANGKNELARLMVTGYYYDSQNNITGAAIHYQYPWKPK